MCECADHAAEANDVYEHLDEHFYGKYRGLVVDNRDPTRRGRLKVRVPAVMGEEEVWALPCAPYAGDGVGFFTLPENDTAVWVEFEAGDPSFPIWVGCFWGDGQIPEGDASPEIKFLRTRKVTLRIDDDQGELLIEVDGSSIKLTASEISLESSSITSRAGGKKTVLTTANFDVHDGALTVM
jgi:uncharacterized protein involved in type VI secretion and phage assembly